MNIDISNFVFLLIITNIISVIFTCLFVVMFFRIKTQKKIFVLEKNLGISLEKNILLEKSLAQAQDVEGKLSLVFEGLSSRVLQNNSHAYLQQTREQMRGFINPLLRDIQKLEVYIQNLEKERAGTKSQLETKITGLGLELSNLQNANIELRESADRLYGALKSDSATRGKWGEIQLRRIVEMAGMVSYIDFEEQVQVRSMDSIVKPDMIIRLPHKGVIPVDAKVPMHAYLRACDAKTLKEKEYFLTEHKKALNSHVRSLANKEYWNQFDTAPQLVILFLPYESGLEASLKSDPNLLDNALDKKVIIAGPSTLYAFLKVISYGWMQVEFSKNVSHIADISKDLVQRFDKFYTLFLQLGTRLNETVDSFNESARSLESRFIPKMREIKQLRKDKEIEVLEKNKETFIGTQAKV